jgi:RimJ/RimL family protein N-acetyltransferase
VPRQGTIPGVWPTAQAIEARRIVLEPLRVEHSEETFAVLDDPRLHRYISGSPLTRTQLRERYARLSAGRSPDGRHGWLNWIVRERMSGAAIGHVQATLSRPPQDATDIVAELAWTIGHAHQGNGYATEAAIAMAGWLQTQGVARLAAHIHPEHEASAKVAGALGLEATARRRDFEVRWESGSPPRTDRSPAEP